MNRRKNSSKRNHLNYLSSSCSMQSYPEYSQFYARLSVPWQPSFLPSANVLYLLPVFLLLPLSCIPLAPVLALPVPISPPAMTCPCSSSDALWPSSSALCTFGCLSQRPPPPPPPPTPPPPPNSCEPSPPTSSPSARRIPLLGVLVPVPSPPLGLQIASYFALLPVFSPLFRGSAGPLARSTPLALCP